METALPVDVPIFVETGVEIIGWMHIN